MTTTATTTRQIRDYAAPFFSLFPFSPSPLVALPSSLPCASFARISFSPHPSPFFLPLFFRKKHLLQLHGRFSKGWPDFIPSRCAPSGSAPLEKTLNTLLRASRVPGAAFLSRLFLSPSRGIPCIFPYPRIRRDTPSPPKRFRERSLSLSQIVDPMFTSVEIKESSGVTRFLLPLFLFLPISTIPKRVFSSFLVLTDSNRVRENKLSDTAER